MNTEEAVTLLTQELKKIAPEIESEDIDLDEDIREEFDIDSVDFLNLVAAISKQLAMSIPESDYSQMSTFSELVLYLQKRTTDLRQ